MQFTNLCGKISPLIALTAALCVSGCGGGGSSSSSGTTGSDGTGTVQTFGSLTAHVTGTISPPVTASGSGAVVTGVYGANILSLATAPSLDISQTSIAFDRNGNVMAVSANGGAARNITTDLTTYSNASSPSWGAGTLIAFQRYDPTIGKFQIYTINPDGTNEQKISTGGFNDYDPALSPNGRFIVFSRLIPASGFTQIWLMGSNGSSPKQLSDGTASDSSPTWSPDMRYVAFSRYTGGYQQIYEMGSQGNNPAPFVVNPNYATYNCYSPAFSPDGTKIAFSMQVGSYSSIYATRTDGKSFQGITASNSTYNDYAPTFSPDGRKIAFSRATGSGTTSIWVASAIDGSGAYQLAYGATGFGDATPNWSPFTPSVQLLGTGGTLGTSAGGFLYGQQGTTIASVLTFDAQTRSGLSLTNQTGVNGIGPNIVFGLSATTSLTSLAYRNGLTNSPVTVIGTGGLSGTTATQAIISYDASTGAVASVLPYTSSAASVVAAGQTGALKPSISGTTLAYHGKFLGAWDGTGKNLAPNGATDVQINGRTGALISVK